MISRIPTCLTLWALTASCFAVSATLHAQDEADEQTVHSMCRLGLATSAVDYVNARELASSDRDLAAKWTMLLMECHAQAGLYGGRSEDDNGNRGAAEQWGKCRSVYDTFIDSEQDNPRLPWLQWQLARCELLRSVRRGAILGRTGKCPAA
ncbi:MAG: hypothetical protein R3C56_15490 [Pirellulaceae bacterium]